MSHENQTFGCRTLADMSDAERAALEARYGAKIVEPGQELPVERLGDSQLLMRASAASRVTGADGRQSIPRARRAFLKDLGAYYSGSGALTEPQRATLREMILEGPPHKASPIQPSRHGRSIPAKRKRDFAAELWGEGGR